MVLCREENFALDLMCTEGVRIDTYVALFARFWFVFFGCCKVLLGRSGLVALV